MSKFDEVAYMDDVQTAFMKDVKVNGIGEDVMFRLVDAAPLTPRHRVEVGVTIGGIGYLVSNTRLRDAKKVGKDMAQFVNMHVTEEAN